MAANLIPSSHSFRFISLSGSIPKMEINRRMRKMLWHNTFTDIIENTAPFSKAFTLAILTLVNVALKWISSSLYEGDYRSWQHLWRGESLLNLSYMQHLFDNKMTLMINPGLSLLNYKLHTQPKCQDWTFRTNSWIRYQLHSNHQFSLGFAMGNFQPDISYVNTADQTIDFLRIQRGNPNLANPTIQEYFFTYDATLNPVNKLLAHPN